MDTAILEYLTQLAKQLEQVGHGKKTPLIDKAAVFLNCSNKKVYELLRDANLTKPRKTRTDKGNTKITREQALRVSSALMTAQRNNGKKTLSIKRSGKIMQDNDLLPDAHPSTISRVLKSYHLHPDQLSVPKAHIRQRSLYPNHVWQIDPSVCVIFYLPKEKGGKVTIMDEKQFYKNKLENIVRTIDQRVTRYVICDHYSGALYVEYVMGTESADNLTQVFINALQHRSPQDPMHGVPDILMLDKGSANTSKVFLNLLDRLGIRYLTHATGNSRAKGAVEKANDIVECEFEGRLRMMDTSHLEQLNTKATQWRLYFNHTAIHTRTGKSRNAVWLSINKLGKLKTAPSIEICRELVTTAPKTIKVRGDLTITHTVKGYPNQAYDISHIVDIYPKAKVDIVVNPYRAPDIDVIWQNNIYTVSPALRDEAGFIINDKTAIIGDDIISHTDRISDSNRQDIYELSYGVKTEQDVDKAQKQRQVAFNSEIDPMADIKSDQVPNYLIAKSQPANYDQTHAKPKNIALLNYVEAAMQLRGLIGDKWNSEHFADLQKQYPHGVPHSAINEIADRIVMGKPVNYLKAVNE